MSVRFIEISYHKMTKTFRYSIFTLVSVFYSPLHVFCINVTIPGIKAFLEFSKANSVLGERMNIFVLPYLTSSLNLFSSIRTLTPSLSVPALKFGQVNWEIILYLKCDIPFTKAKIIKSIFLNDSAQLLTYYLNFGAK